MLPHPPLLPGVALAATVPSVTPGNGLRDMLGPRIARKRATHPH